MSYCEGTGIWECGCCLCAWDDYDDEFDCPNCGNYKTCSLSIKDKTHAEYVALRESDGDE